MISHRSLTKLSLIPALLCQAALTRIVWVNCRLHRSQTPAACSHKLACFFVRLLFLSHPSGLNPSSWHLNAPPQLGGYLREGSEWKWMSTILPSVSSQGASDLQLLPVELPIGHQKTTVWLCSTGVSVWTFINIKQDPNWQCFHILASVEGLHTALRVKKFLPGFKPFE